MSQINRKSKGSRSDNFPVSSIRLSTLFLDLLLSARLWYGRLYTRSRIQFTFPEMCRVRMWTRFKFSFYRQAFLKLIFVPVIALFLHYFHPELEAIIWDEIVIQRSEQRYFRIIGNNIPCFGGTDPAAVPSLFAARNFLRKPDRIASPSFLPLKVAKVARTPTAFIQTVSWIHPWRCNTADRYARKK